MLKYFVLSVASLLFFESAQATMDDLEILDFQRKSVVSCRSKERSSKYVNFKITSICDVIEQLKGQIEPSKSYYLNLQGNIINNDAALKIMDFMLKTPQIIILDLSNNSINQVSDMSEIEARLNALISEKKGRQVILTGNKIWSLNLLEEDVMDQPFTIPTVSFDGTVIPVN